MKAPSVRMRVALQRIGLCCASVLWLSFPTNRVAAADEGAETGVADFGVMVREFSQARHKLARELAQRLEIPYPNSLDRFFKAAAAGDWPAVSNRFQQLLVKGTAGQSADPEVQNELWATAHETLGIYEVWEGWRRDSDLLAQFYEPVLASMPPRSIYFGGTDSGRFVITTANAVRDPPPVFVITQNALADNTYMAHLRAVYGDQLWIPSRDDSNQAFKRYVDEVKAAQTNASSELEFSNGRVTVRGVEGVMRINGILCEMIFDHNKAGHEFFVEESYIIRWMYPHLEPHGFIMKLHPEPMAELSGAAVARDRAFWTRKIGELEKLPGFAGNEEARRAFAKMRCGSAGIYVYRKRYDEAEQAFRQALRLYRMLPEANFRLASLLEEQGKLEAAREVLAAYGKIAPADMAARVEDYLRRIDAQLAGDVSPATIP